MPEQIPSRVNIDLKFGELTAGNILNKMKISAEFGYIAINSVNDITFNINNSDFILGSLSKHFNAEVLNSRITINIVN